MNTKGKSPFSSIVVKVLLALALTAVMLVVLSGIVVNLNSRIKVLSRAEVVSGQKSFASLPEYGYIQAHQVRTVAISKAAPLTGFQALPEYNYIKAHGMVGRLETYFPAGMQNLTVFEYIQSHARLDTIEDVDTLGSAVLTAVLPEGLRTMPVYAYIAAHNRPGTQIFVAGLPAGLLRLPEAGYIQMMQEAGSQ